MAGIGATPVNIIGIAQYLNSLCIDRKLIYKKKYLIFQHVILSRIQYN